MRWEWLTENEYSQRAAGGRLRDPRFLDPAFPVQFRRCFKAYIEGQEVIGVVCKSGKQMILGGILNESPLTLQRSLRFFNRLMWLWGCQSGVIGSQSGLPALPLSAPEDQPWEIRSLGNIKKSGRCREGACRIEWVKENPGVGIMKCQIDPQTLIQRLESQIMTVQEKDVVRRGKAIAQIHHWHQLAEKLGPRIDAGGLRFVCIQNQAWITASLPSAYSADPQYLRMQLVKKLMEMGITLQPEPVTVWAQWQRRLFMPIKQKGDQGHLAG